MDIPLLFLAGAIVLFFLVLFTVIPVGLWVSAVAAGVKVSLLSLVAMRLRRVPPHRIILPLIKADKAGIDVSQDQLEAHFLAGGNIDRVV
ncbi:MAG: flotillin-like FloA family protein, partial [Trueperaceae bacterium]